LSAVSSRARISGLLFIVVLMCAWGAAPARSDAPANYEQTAVNGLLALPNQGFGAQTAAIDLDFDGITEMVVAVPGVTPGEIEVIARKREPAPKWSQPFWSQSLDPDPGSTSRYETSVATIVDPQTETDLNGDFVPEILVGAVDTNAAAGDQGRVYVLDGATGGMLKRIELPPGDQLATGTGEFGRSLLSPGDLAIGGAFDQIPDFAVGAPGWPGGGRVYVYRGSDITGDPNAAVSPAHTMQNPFGDVGRFGETLIPIGDAGHCIDTGGSVDCTGPNAENRTDGAPDVFVGAPGSVIAGLPGAGAALLVDGRRGKVFRKVDNPAPQIGGRFGATLHRQPKLGDEFGDLNGDLVPDAFVGAPGHDANEGAGYFLNGDINASAVLFTVRDPDPAIGAEFGSAAASLGVDGFAVGAPFGTARGEVRLFNPNRSLARTICDPDNQVGGRFGASVASLGDLNADGFPDLAVSAPSSDHDGAQNAGRIHALESIGPAVTGRKNTCQRPPGGGTTGGGDPGPGPGPVFDFSDEDVAVTARVLRRLSMKPNRKRVRKASYFRLRGTLTAVASRNVCQRRQKIALQRRKAKGNRFQTFEVAVTRASGKFTARAIAGRTYTYRARVSRTSRCMGAISKTAKVRIVRGRGAR
jgi:FG-GAP repeat